MGVRYLLVMGILSLCGCDAPLGTRVETGDSIAQANDGDDAAKKPGGRCHAIDDGYWEPPVSNACDYSPSAFYDWPSDVEGFINGNHLLSWTALLTFKGNWDGVFKYERKGPGEDVRAEVRFRCVREGERAFWMPERVSYNEFVDVPERGTDLSTSGVIHISRDGHNERCVDAPDGMYAEMSWTKIGNEGVLIPSRPYPEFVREIDSAEWSALGHYGLRKIHSDYGGGPVKERYECSADQSNPRRSRSGTSTFDFDGNRLGASGYEFGNSRIPENRAEELSKDCAF
jgi:hypothetical protein